MNDDNEFDNEFDDEFDITTETIGSIDRDDGNDEYVLLTRLVDDLTPDDAREWLLPQVYCQTYQEAGGYFCRNVTTTQAGSANKVIAIIHHRYDI